VADLPAGAGPEGAAAAEPAAAQPVVAPESAIRAGRFRRAVLTPTTARIVALIAVCAFFSIANEFFLSSSNLLNIVLNTVVVGIVAAPLTLLLVARQVDLSVGSAVALAAITLAVAVEAGYGLAVGVVAAMAAAMLVAVVNAFAITKLRVNSIVATLGTLAAFRGLAKLEGNGRNIRVDNFNLLGRARIDILGIHVPLAVFILLAVLLFFWFLMSQTRYGRHMYGMGASPKAALLAGIDLRRNVVIGFLLTGLAVGLAALISVSEIGAVAPTTGEGLELLAITGIILGGASLAGGRGTIPGTIIAILILAVLDNGLTLSRITSFWQEVVRGSLLVAAVALDQARLARGKPDVRFEL
jgi:ribose/xylose/arabinose/galactoside ABC-type transport system permease subunit